MKFLRFSISSPKSRGGISFIGSLATVATLGVMLSNKRIREVVRDRLAGETPIAVFMSDYVGDEYEDDDLVPWDDSKE